MVARNRRRNEDAMMWCSEDKRKCLRKAAYENARGCSAHVVLVKTSSAESPAASGVQTTGS